MFSSSISTSRGAYCVRECGRGSAAPRVLCSRLIRGGPPSEVERGRYRQHTQDSDARTLTSSKCYAKSAAIPGVEGSDVLASPAARSVPRPAVRSQVSTRRTGGERTGLPVRVEAHKLTEMSQQQDDNSTDIRILNCSLSRFLFLSVLRSRYRQRHHHHPGLTHEQQTAAEMSTSGSMQRASDKGHTSVNYVILAAKS
jgi:hypothetical protein